MNSRVSKFFRATLIIASVTSYLLGNLGVLWGTGVQPPPGQGHLYLTKDEYAPNGAVVTPLDLQAGLFQTVIRDLGSPDNVLCGPDGRLYVIDLWQRSAANQRVNRILRYNQDGSGRKIVAQWDSGFLRPGSMVLASNGDLYFGTISTGQTDAPLRGIWRIPGALQANEQFSSPEQVLPQDLFGEGRYGVEPFAFLNSGPFAGDVLIIAGRGVLRAQKPNFSTVVDFIPFDNDPETGEPHFASALAVNSLGEVLLVGGADVLRFGSDGTYRGVFAKVRSGNNQITIGPDDLVYVTTPIFNPARAGGLFIFDPQGKPIESADFPLHLRGVTVCTP